VYPLFCAAAAWKMKGMQNSELANRHKKTRIQHSLKQVALFSGIYKRARKLNIKSAQVTTLINDPGLVNGFDYGARTELDGNGKAD
jgi:hypothetical protein